MTYLIHHTDDADDKPTVVSEEDAERVLRNNFSVEASELRLEQLKKGEVVMVTE